MRFIFKLIISLIILTFSIFFLITKLSNIGKIQTKPYVVCTTSIITNTVQEIGQDLIIVDSLMGPGVDPHLYKPVENDIVKIATADLIFYNGLHLEARMADMFQQISSWKFTVAVTQDIETSQLIPAEEYEEMYDPHVWFDINLWSMAVQTICNSLIKLDPAHQKEYQNNTNAYLQKLQKLFTKSSQMLNAVPQQKRVLITGHDAFSYFGKLYNYKVIGLQGISTESCPGTQDVQKLVNFICDNDIPAIFIESSIPTKNITVLQEGVLANNKTVEIGDELYSDALGPPNSDGDSYIKMIEHNSKTIANFLNRH